MDEWDESLLWVKVFGAMLVRLGVQHDDIVKELDKFDDVNNYDLHNMIDEMKAKALTF